MNRAVSPAEAAPRPRLEANNSMSAKSEKEVHPGKSREMQAVPYCASAKAYCGADWMRRLST